LTFAQDPQQRVFRGGVQTVPIYATVVDATGRLVPDLKQEDFEVLDNGKVTPITSVRRGGAADFRRARHRYERQHDARPRRFRQAGAEAFVLRMLPADRGLIGAFDDKIRFSQQFTNKRDELLRYLRTEVQFGNGTRLWTRWRRASRN
jgi:hypothetical protein